MPDPVATAPASLSVSTAPGAPVAVPPGVAASTPLALGSKGADPTKAAGHSARLVAAFADAFGVHPEDAKGALASLRKAGFDVYEAATVANV